MSGSEIPHLKGFRSVLMEFFIKPVFFASVVLIYPLMRWMCPPKQMATHDIVIAANLAAVHNWNKDTVGNRIAQLKTFFVCYVIASFLEADNAYLQFFLRFNIEFQKQRNVWNIRKQLEGESHDQKKARSNKRTAPKRDYKGRFRPSFWAETHQKRIIRPRYIKNVYTGKR